MPSENNPILSREQIITAIEENRKELEKSLCFVLEKLIASYDENRKRTGKGALANIYISLLRTAVPFKSPLYRIDFYDNQKHLDLIEHSAKWDISFLSDIIYTDMFYNPNVMIRLSDRQNYTNEQNWFQNAALLHEVLIEYMGNIIKYIQTISDISFDGITFYMGEYLSQATLIMFCQATEHVREK